MPGCLPQAPPTLLHPSRSPSRAGRGSVHPAQPPMLHDAAPRRSPAAASPPLSSSPCGPQGPTHRAIRFPSPFSPSLKLKPRESAGGPQAKRGGRRAQGPGRGALKPGTAAARPSELPVPIVSIGHLSGRMMYVSLAVTGGTGGKGGGGSGGGSRAAAVGGGGEPSLH